MAEHKTLLLKVSAVLRIIWCLVHTLAGDIVLSSDAYGGFAAILGQEVERYAQQQSHEHCGRRIMLGQELCGKCNQAGNQNAGKECLDLVSPDQAAPRLLSSGTQSRIPGPL